MKQTASITLRKKTDGSLSHQVRIRQAGTPTLTRSFSVLAEAKAWRDETKTKLNKGEQVITKKHRSTTINEAINYYLAHAGIRIKSDAERERLKKLAIEFEGLAIVNLTPMKLEAWKNALLATPIPRREKGQVKHKLYDGDAIKTYKESSVRKYFYALKKALEWYSKFRDFPFNNPFSIVHAPSENNERERRLEEGEEERLLNACDQMYKNKQELKNIIALALETAMRTQEILKMKWTDVNFLERRIILPKQNTKTKKERQIPLTSVALQVLKRHESTKKVGEPRVFWMWGNSDALGHRFKVITKNGGLEDFKFHDFRHEATSRFYERTSLTDVQISLITGHSEFKSLKRYANLRSNNLADKLW